MSTEILVHFETLSDHSSIPTLFRRRCEATVKVDRRWRSNAKRSLPSRSGRPHMLNFTQTRTGRVKRGTTAVQWCATGIVNLSGNGRRQKMSTNSRTLTPPLPALPMIFIIRRSFLGPKNCHSSQSVTLTGVTESGDACTIVCFFSV